MIILASNSPRRKELLSMLGYSFNVIPSDCDETCEIKNPKMLVKLLAKQKAEAVFEKNKDSVIIGSDTIVAIKKHILGKPKDKNSAINMLKTLSGKAHTVYTGICIIKGNTIINDTVSCKVYFKKLSDTEILNYVNSGEPMDKAGAYAIQGKGAAFIEKIKGDYYSVVGLPCNYIDCTLKNLGIYPTE